MRVASADAYAEWRDVLAHDWVLFFDRLGITPVFIPNSLSEPKRYVEDLGVDVFFLTGGGQCPSSVVNAGRAGQSARDITEKLLLDYSVQERKPVFGICRGFQFINMYFGGEITRNLALSEFVHGAHVGTQHEICLTDGDWLQMAASTKLLVNSYHDDGVLIHQLAPCLSVTAVSGDDPDLVEGFKHQSLPLWGIQWHPERTGSSAAFDESLIRCLMEKGAEY